ncbi:UDP-GlcNAc:betaGal beta-1,3-N-acetylglucosaminyltransferase-like protein 1 [Lingula anatina]|uniref:UDP-GlcNAc:betaGal beta-1,3-N-acetylglucosaminyltransferase-like protein 1 n=1 Tax=Lingula anatina TaxID=7574 RepID=A0A1S3HN17_LINAN|nr:UDP-GlcNAc:betaGal beta-1,3-N-acetylglucosaminyltransferase-like protein 1 [Lingula anatina]|eukprot:XP_013387422.1 UDP-GlcNAc:betaGal beta-1,3-N-acetylglucosaminyltransferase-like protein 1 [Lingula anatina]
MVDVSIILPVYNAEKWLNESLHSIIDQNFEGTLELSVFNDGSTDRSYEVLSQWRSRLEAKGIKVILGGHSETQPKGVGAAKNHAVKQSAGTYLCFFDADDVMLKDRVQQQYKAALAHPKSLIGCQFYREPANSTSRYTNWANSLSQDQLFHQAYTSHGPTVIMPTWFCSRAMFEEIGEFSEAGKGTPEDLIFFYRLLEMNLGLYRVDQCLLMYRYHPEATTFSVLEETIWNLRVSALEDQVLSKWSAFTIWNAGKQGRKLYRSLQPHNQNKVLMLCDVDKKKTDKGVYTYEESKCIPKPKIPIVHFTRAKPPFIICVKQDMTGGQLEENLASLQLTEGKDYIHFN